MNFDFIGDNPNYFNSITSQTFMPDFKYWDRQGWICPKCMRVYSPDTPMCLYCGQNTNTTSTTIDTDTFLVHFKDLPIYQGYKDDD